MNEADADRIEGARLINFEKRRKEFELLRMISALQSNCSQNTVLRGTAVSGMFTTWVSFVQVSQNVTEMDDSYFYLTEHFI